MNPLLPRSWRKTPSLAFGLLFALLTFPAFATFAAPAHAQEPTTSEAPPRAADAATRN